MGLKDKHDYAKQVLLKSSAGVCSTQCLWMYEAIICYEMLIFYFLLSSLLMLSWQETT